MGRNKGKGGKNRQKGRKEEKRRNEKIDERRELEFKEDGQQYAMVSNMLGSGRCKAICDDGKIRLCRIRGALYMKVWINSGDLVLVGLRDYQDDKADIILKYYPNEARLLGAYGELPENFKINNNEDGDNEEDDFVRFEEDVVIEDI